MDYIFDEQTFIESFNAKNDDSKSMDSIRLTHKPDGKFKLFPYKASGKSQAPIVTEMADTVSGFFRETVNKVAEPISFDGLCKALCEEVDLDDQDLDYFRDMIQSFFFVGENFVADNLGLYPYQTSSNNKSADNLAHFIYSVMEIDDEICKKIEQVKAKHQFNVLEDMVINAIENKNVIETDKNKPYFVVKKGIQDVFKADFEYMLESGMTSLEDLSNLFAVYYLYYVSQTCFILDHFGVGNREQKVKLYFALDWEKVSKNRKCCLDGWENLQENINHMFTHAITLEILNQTKNGAMLDYISFAEMAQTNDDELAAEIKKAEQMYCSYIGDFKGFDSILYTPGSSKTDEAIIHLFKCVQAQFRGTDRKRAEQFYNEKFSEFCKSRWLKNRKKSGWVLNLTERDVIFLTKICLRDEEKIRLNDLYKEYEKRGIYLDNTSKEYLQDFFTKLNLIDKKSDSGDAQYVKRIL